MTAAEELNVLRLRRAGQHLPSKTETAILASPTLVARAPKTTLMAISGYILKDFFARLDEASTEIEKQCRRALDDEVQQEMVVWFELAASPEFNVPEAFRMPGLSSDMPTRVA